MSDDITGSIGRMLYGPLRFPTATPVDDVLRVAELRERELGEAAEPAGLQIVFTIPENEAILEISVLG